ncbi:lysophospholipid acyltransferase family protein [Nitrospira moscoviensis]|uniref:Phospholipid/glycerol acyltransferase n=1 Tax=Nitrospira moscoviensis TaxID=42253 RepID=A0A0K2G974_NITMO|nr:lysophospholipid acyltransferase family protein [Nitrospira moscoviensis]ALA57503.1 Phospholipid/glycerol acyltransferase [Nitrospira moscoviensis]
MALQHLFFLLIVRPLVLIVLGMNVRHRERLPAAGPAIVVSNHNSHLDTLVLMTLLPWRLLPALRPVGASDYFFSHPLLAWFSKRIMHIIPLARQVTTREDPLAECSAALECKEILILFPEGSRGDPEHMGTFKTGIAHLAKRHPDVPIVPVFLHGLGKALPRGEALLVPFFCDVFVGEPLKWTGEKAGFMTSLEQAVKALSEEGYRPAWE